MGDRTKPRLEKLTTLAALANLGLPRTLREPRGLGFNLGRATDSPEKAFKTVRGITQSLRFSFGVGALTEPGSNNAGRRPTLCSSTPCRPARRPPSSPRGSRARTLQHRLCALRPRWPPAPAKAVSRETAPRLRPLPRHRRADSLFSWFPAHTKARSGTAFSTSQSFPSASHHHFLRISFALFRPQCHTALALQPRVTHVPASVGCAGATWFSGAQAQTCEQRYGRGIAGSARSWREWLLQFG